MLIRKAVCFPYTSFKNVSRFSYSPNEEYSLWIRPGFKKGLGGPKGDRVRHAQRRDTKAINVSYWLSLPTDVLYCISIKDTL